MSWITQNEKKSIDGIAHSWFAVLYFLLAGLSFNSITAGRRWMNGFILFVVVCGGILLFRRACRWKEYRKTPLIWLWASFLISYGISSLLTAQYGVMENGKAIIWMALELFLLYPMGARLTEGDRLYGEKVFYGTIVLYTAIQAVVSLGMLAVGYSAVSEVRGQYIGLQLGRLWGSYSDPNYGAILSVVSILCSLWILRHGEKGKVVWRSNIGLQYLYIAFSYSRSGQVCLAVAGLLAYWVIWPKIRKEGWKKLLLALVLLLVLIPGIYVVREGYNRLHLTVYAAESEGSALHREEELKEDISNGRFAIWKDGWDVFRVNPVFGISYRNIAPYMKEYFPDSYMVTKENALNTFHNMWVDVAVSQGSVGFLLLMGAVFCLGKKTIRMLPGWKEPEFFQHFFPFLVVIVIGIGAFFVSDVFYVNTPTAVIFWFCLGRCLDQDKCV